MVAACDWWLEADNPRHVWSARLVSTLKTQIPFAAVTAVYMGLRLYALQGPMGNKATHTAGEVLCESPSLLWFYVRKLVIPSGLSPIYSDPNIGPFASAQFCLLLITVCAVGVALFFWGHRFKAAAFSGLLLTFSLLPPLMGVWVFKRNDLAHDRYLYLPSAGACMLLALALQKGTHFKKPATTAKIRWLGHLTIIAVALGFAFSVRAQEQPYRNNLALPLALRRFPQRIRRHGVFWAKSS
jgi:hypothetical protein